MATRDVFSEDELAQLRGFPEPARAELIRYFTLAPPDELFVRKFRGRENVMGTAVQLCTLPWLGYVPDDVKAAPAAAVARLSEKLGIPVGELRRYGAREQTRTDHLRDVAAHLGWRQVEGPRWRDLEEFLFARAMEHDSPKLLFRLACEYLSSSRLVRPGVVKILERVATARDRARDETWERLAPALTGHRRAELDRLLEVDPVLGRTRLSWLGAGPVAATPAAVKTELEKLAYLRGMDADTLDLSVLPAERRRFLAGVGRRLTAQNLARRDADRKYPILLTRAEELLSLNVEDLDLEFRRGRVTSKGGAIEYVHWATGTARLLPRLLRGRTSGPVFLAGLRAPVSGSRAPAEADVCPETGRGRLSAGPARTAAGGVPAPGTSAA